MSDLELACLAHLKSNNDTLWSQAWNVHEEHDAKSAASWLAAEIQAVFALLLRTDEQPRG